MKNYQKGQVLLIVVLIMTVVLTIGLSVATRTITNLRTTYEEESSQRAFSAAEAGIEKALQTDADNSGSFTNHTTYTATIDDFAGIEFLLNNGAPILKDNFSDVWLSTYPGYGNPWTGSLTIYWGSASDDCEDTELDNTMAALEITMIVGTKINPSVVRYPVDPCSDRSSENFFDNDVSGGGTIGGQALGFHTTIDVNAGLLMRIMPLYASTIVGVRGCDAAGGNCQNLPAQGKAITSVGSADMTQRKIVGFQEYPKLPLQMFPFLIFVPK